MAILYEYARPSDVDEALALLAKNEGRLLPLAGGTLLVGQLETRSLTGIDGVVDLRDTGLDSIRVEGDVVRMGAMCALSGVTAHPALCGLADGLLVRAARGEGPVNLRNAATVGGVVACAEYDSEFYAALLALDASVTVRRPDGTEETRPLAQCDAVRGLIVEVTLALRDLRGGAARVARTPSDRPIVAAYAVRTPGVEPSTRIALCGVADRPLPAGATLAPPDDFKGSAEYRLAMAEIVVRRAVAEAEEADSNAG